MGHQRKPCSFPLTIRRDVILQIGDEQMQIGLGDFHRRLNRSTLALCRTIFFFHYRNKPPPALHRRYCILSYYSLIRTAIVSCPCGGQWQKKNISSGNYSLLREQL